MPLVRALADPEIAWTVAPIPKELGITTKDR
jgi:hypothetical protein